MASYPTTYHNSIKEMLANPNLHQAIAQAVVHAHEVCGREHIKGDRHERVRQFCNSLRSFVSCRFNRGVVSASGLLSHRMWCDAGVLSTQPHIQAAIGLGTNIQDIRDCVMKSAQYMPHEEDEEKSIREELRAVNVSLEVSKAATERLSRLAVEADALDAKFETFEKELNEHT